MSKPFEYYEPGDDTHMMQRVLREREATPTGRALDVGTGSGALAATLQELGWPVVATDINPHAASATREKLGPVVARGDLAKAMRGPFEVVVFNPPYLPSDEDERLEGWIDAAFHGGEGGIEVTLAFLADLPRYLAPGGRAYIVVSDRADLAGLTRAIDAAGFEAYVMASMRFFFEEIAIWRIVRK